MILPGLCGGGVRSGWGLCLGKAPGGNLRRTRPQVWFNTCWEAPTFPAEEFACSQEAQPVAGDGAEVVAGALLAPHGGLGCGLGSGDIKSCVLSTPEAPGRPPTSPTSMCTRIPHSLVLSLGGHCVLTFVGGGLSSDRSNPWVTWEGDCGRDGSEGSHVNLSPGVPLSFVTLLPFCSPFLSFLTFPCLLYN